MSNFTDQLEQIKTLISSTSKSEKSFAYSTLHQLQEQSSLDDSLISSLVEFNQSFLSPIISDIRDADVDADEEIVTMALKCLGFMIYHPSIVAAIPKGFIDQVLESLARLITTAKVKLVCNLGVWCISIQQLDASNLACHFNSLLMAIVHSLDNPVGSLSTTFEAIQAVMKLATQISEKMRDTSSLWAPPIYRRLLSADKREREMCLRCLLKIKCLIVPPSLTLSKAIAQDMKLRLLPEMKELLKHDKKVQALQAWRWFISLLGSYSLKNRLLVNELLKVPEQTFSDPDPQAQNASLVAWEGLIDALIHLPSKVCDVVTISQHQVEQNKEKPMDLSEVNGRIVQTGGYSKSLKLIMTPLIGIMTSKTDLSVQASCLNTWCYLLHKLDILVNDPRVLDTVVEPMFKVVFNSEIEDSSIWIWRFCVNLLEDFIQAKLASVDSGSLGQASCDLSVRTRDYGCPVSGECSLKNYSVKWLPWDCSQIDFLVRMINMAFNQATVNSCLENRSFSVTVLCMFRSFLKGVHVDLAKSSTTYYSVMRSINAVLMFVKTVCETALNGDDVTNDFRVTCLRVLDVVTQELPPSVLGSPLYKVALEVKYVSDLRVASEERCKMLMDTSPMCLMDMVPPVVLLTVLYSSIVVQVSYKASSTTCILQEEAYHYFDSLFSAYDSLEVIQTVVGLLYVCIEHSSLLVWSIVVKCLRDYLSEVKDLVPLKIQPASSGSFAVCHFLIYPIIACYFQKPLITLQHCNTSVNSFVSSKNLAFEQVTELWASIYCLVNSSHRQGFRRTNLFAEDLSSFLKGFLQRINMTEEVGASFNHHDHHLLFLCGEVAKCILENLYVERVTPEAIKCGYTGASGITSCLEFAAWVMNITWSGNDDACFNVAISRLLSSLASFVGSLQWQEDIFTLIKVLCDPLVLWLSDTKIKCESINHQLQLLWIEITRSLQRSWPAIVFDNSFLKLQAPLLEKTLDHPSPSILEPTITFWNSSYGDQSDLDFPPCLLQVLDKLLRLGKIKIKKQAPTLGRDSSSLKVDSRSRYEVTATLRTCSKRVGLSENMMDDTSCKKELPPYPKRKLELTEHQREVRRAQQRKGRDCSGHGPGIRTYTSVDFSQGNDESQDSQDIRDPELILDLLKKTS